MSSDYEKEDRLAERLLKAFEEKSPLDYDILDSTLSELRSGKLQDRKISP